GPDRGPHEAAFEPFKELLLALALVAHPAVEVDKRLDLVVACRGHRDDVAAVGVADEHDRTGQGPQEFGEVSRVASEIAKRVGEPDGGKPAVAQGADLGVEAGRVGPGTVYKDDRRDLTDHCHHRFLLGRVPPNRPEYAPADVRKRPERRQELELLTRRGRTEPGSR